MRTFLLALVTALSAVAMTVGVASPAAAQESNAIVDVSVQPGGTWTDAATHLTYRLYTVTVEFTHRGPIAVQVDEHAVGSGERLVYDSGGVGRSGTDTVSFQMGYGLVGQPVYVEAWLYKPGKLVGKRPGVLKGEVICDSWTTGTYTN